MLRMVVQRSLLMCDKSPSQKNEINAYAPILLSDYRTLYNIHHNKVMSPQQTQAICSQDKNAGTHGSECRYQVFISIGAFARKNRRVMILVLEPFVSGFDQATHTRLFIALLRIHRAETW